MITIVNKKISQKSVFVKKKLTEFWVSFPLSLLELGQTAFSGEVDRQRHAKRSRMPREAIKDELEVTSLCRKSLEELFPFFN